MTAYKGTFLLLSLLIVQLSGIAQDTEAFRGMGILDSAKQMLRSLRDSASFRFKDSTYVRLFPSFNEEPLLSEYSQFIPTVDKILITHPPTSAPLVQFQNGFIQYEWNYMSGVDTPFVETNVSQHFITGVANLLIKDLVPIRVTYFQRQSNSSLFHDIHDVRIELNTSEFQRIQMKSLRRTLVSRIEKLADTNLYKIAGLAEFHKFQLTSWLNSPVIRKKYINSQELLLSPDLTATLTSRAKDSALKEAKMFLTFFQKVERTRKKYTDLADSLSQVSQQARQKFAYLKSLANGNLVDAVSMRQIEKALGDKDPNDKRILERARKLGSIRTFELGRTSPNFSSLTLRNINVKGVNFEYNYNRFFTAIAAGGIDYHMRDFILPRAQTPAQGILGVRVGYGRKEQNNVIFSYLNGRKQTFPYFEGGKALNVQNISVAGQLMLSKYSRVAVEFAESITQVSLGMAGVDKTSKHLSDPANQAFSIGLQSIIRATKTKLEGRYQRTGINFQSFTNYSTNSSATAWSVKGEQDFWKRSITFTGELRKDDFTNPAALQRYSANAIFKSFNLLVRRPGLPALSFGFLPSSQYSVVDSIVYENHYQILNGVISHQFAVGEANCYSSMMFSRYYNEAKDSGFLYYNANNFFFSQVFMFPLFSISATISSFSNGVYTLNVWDGGVRLNISGRHSFVCGVKTNTVSTDQRVRMGYYANARLSVRNLGDLNANLERNQYPDGHHQLQQRDFFSLSFTRIF